VAAPDPGYGFPRTVPRPGPSALHRLPLPSHELCHVLGLRKHFVQFITPDQAGRPRPAIVRQWVHHLAAAVREKDKRHLMTVGLVDWSLDRKDLTSGFVRDQCSRKRLR
jgi:hypothetical protein